MILTLLVDNPRSWILPYAERLFQDLQTHHTVKLAHSQKDILEGDCLFLLGCEKIITKETLAKNKHNLVIHESALPQGKGWSPLTWQILEGKNEIPITLFEAAESVDSGEIYLQEVIRFEGHELNEELKHAQGEATVALVKKYLENYSSIKGVAQSGEETFYPRRTPKDSELDINKSIKEQFELLRVVDNERYPAFFEYRGKRYTIKIYKESEV